MDAMTGGAKLEEFLRRTAKKVRNAATLKVGFMEGATYPDGTPVAMVAATQNFGAPSQGIPPRPFFSNMIRKHQNEWPDQVAKALKRSDMDAGQALTMMGHLIAGELREEIIDTNEPPLSPVTVMLRYSHRMDEPVTFAMVQEARRRVAAGETPKGVTASGAKPLIYTGHLLNSVEFTVGDDRYAFDTESQSFVLTAEA